MKFDTLTSTLEEKKGLWDNMHARRKAGKPKRKPGDKNYPKTLNVEETCGKGEYFCNDDQKCKPIPEGTKVKSNGELVSEGEAWTRKEGQNKEGGLNEKGRKSYERANPGSDLKAPSKKKGNKRRASFCARMKGMRKRQKPSNNTGEDRLSKSLRAWNCSYEWELDLLEDAKMGKQSDDKLAAAHKKFSGMDQSSPANKFMLKRISKEMDRRKKVNEHHQKDEDGKVIEHEDTPDMEVINPKQPWDKLEEAKVDMKTPDYKRATVRDKRYGNPHGSHELGGGIRKDRRADHEARRGVKKEEIEMTRKAYNKLHKDFKSDDPKNPRTTKYVKGKGTISAPVKFVDEGMLVNVAKGVESGVKKFNKFDDKVTKAAKKKVSKVAAKAGKNIKKGAKKVGMAALRGTAGAVGGALKGAYQGAKKGIKKGMREQYSDWRSEFEQIDERKRNPEHKEASPGSPKGYGDSPVRKSKIDHHTDKKRTLTKLGRRNKQQLGSNPADINQDASQARKSIHKAKRGVKKTKGSKPVQYDKRTMARTDSTKDNPRTSYSKKYGRTVKKELRGKYNEGMYDIDPKTGESPVASKVKAANKLPDKKRLKSLAKLSKEMIGEKKMVKVKLNPKKKIGVKVTDIGPGGKEYVRKDTMGEGTSYGIFKGDGMSFPERMKAKAKKEKEKKKKLVKAEDYFVGTVRDTRWNDNHLDEVLGYAAQIAGGMVRDGVKGLSNPDIKPGKETIKKLQTQAAEKKQTGGASAVKSQQDAKRQAALKKQKEDRRDRAKNIMTAEKAAKKKVKQSDTGQSLRDGEAGGAPNMKPITAESYSSKPSNIIKKAKLSAALDRLQALKVQSKMKKEEVQRDEYGDPIGGPKISKKQLKKNLASNEKDEKITRSEGFIAELKKKTLGSYVRKSSASMAGAAIDNDMKKVGKRYSGIQKATRKLEEDMGKISHTKTKKNGKTIIKVNKNDEADAQAAMKNDPKYILGKTRVQAHKEEADPKAKPMTTGQQKQIEGKKKQQNMIKKQILMKKLMAVRAGADGVAS